MNIELNHKLYGQGHPLIILHGLFGSLDNWATFGRSISKHYMAFLVDQRDHGKSPHTNEFNYDVLSEDLVHFMESNWVHEAFLMGHSMGGKTVMKTALEHPDIVEKLIVVDMAPKAYTNRHSAVFEAMLAVDMSSLEHRKDAKEILMAKLNGDFATTAFLLKNIKREKSGEFRWKMNVELLKRDYQSIIEPMPADKVYEGDTLFIKGANSAYITEDDYPLISQLFPKNQIVSIPDAGHWVHADQPKLLENVVLEFLSD